MKNPTSIQHKQAFLYRTLWFVDLELFSKCWEELDVTFKSKRNAAKTFFWGWVAFFIKDVDASGSTTDYFLNRYTTYKYSFWDKKI
jgi:hypothetical protein